jgi:small-conductance mechanosensitive channel
MRALLLRPWLLFLAVFAYSVASAAEEIDRTTPRRSMQGFLDRAHEGDFDVAAEYLDLRHFDAQKRKTEGPALARDLAYILDHKAPVDVDALPDVPEGADGKSGPVEFAKLTLFDQTVTLQLDRVRGKQGQQRWVVSRSTLALVPELDKVYGAARWQDRMPGWLKAPVVVGNAPWQWLGILVAVALAYVVGRLLGAIALYIARSVARRTDSHADDALIEATRRPLRLVIASLLFRQALELLDLTPTSQTILSRIAYTTLVIGVGWLVIRIARVATELIEDRLGDGPESSDVARRGLRTQLTVVRRVGSVIVVFVSSAIVLLQFDFVRNVGVSLLASAGILSVVFGLAAQKTLGAVLAGIQLSLAQPVRIGDTVTIDSELGDVEEIHLTYVVVRLWDERRLIVPIQRLLDQTFINWTRLGTRLLGTVLVRVDHKMPIDVMRKELDRIVAESKWWDKRTSKLVVFDVAEDSLILRALVSAADPDALSELKNEVREKLVGFVSTFEGGKYVVRHRGETVTS